MWAGYESEGFQPSLRMLRAADGACVPCLLLKWHVLQLLGSIVGTLSGVKQHKIVASFESWHGS